MEIILVRHGESQANKAGKHQGKKDKWADTSLTKKGREQARKIANRLKIEKLEDIYSSDLKRAKETALVINQNHNLKIIYDKRLREKPDNESLEDLILRVKEFYKSIIKKHSKKVIVVAHGGVNLTTLAISTGCKKKGGRLVKRYPSGLENTSVSIIDVKDGVVKRKKINCVKHLN